MSAPELRDTRLALHAVAELVLAGPQHRASGTIRLRVTAGGFRTWTGPALAVVGTDLLAGEQRIALSGRTPRQLAAEAGLSAGAPAGVYAGTCGVDVDSELAVDAGAAARLEEAWACGEAALRLLAPDCEPVLWPEHFDVAIRLDEVNYGVSPGDGYLGEPYAYVGVDPVPADPFWNAPFGAATPMTALADPDSLCAWFAAARGRWH